MKSIIKIARLESQIAKEKEKLLLYEEQRTKHMYNVFHGGTEYTQNLAQKEVNKLKTLLRKTKAKIEEKEKELSILLSDEKANATNTIAQSQTKQEETIQEVAQSEQLIQEVITHEDTIQQIQGDSIEYSFKQYIESLIPINDITTQELNNNIVFSFSIKKSDLMTFKAPKVYASYEHSLKIKQGQEIARQKGIRIGLKKGSKRERKDKQSIIESIKSLSNSFNGNMTNKELSKYLNCSLNRICSYKREIKEHLEKSQLNLFTE